MQSKARLAASVILAVTLSAALVATPSLAGMTPPGTAPLHSERVAIR